MKTDIPRDFAFFVCHHKEGPWHGDSIFTPIHVGAAGAKKALPHCVRDDTGDNISNKNTAYCELTALYWMWKNVEAKYYGLFHYRRLLNFKRVHSRTLNFHDFSPKTIDDFGWTREQIGALCEDYDILTSPRWNVHPVGINHMVMSNYEFYAKDHFVRDFDLALAKIKERSPEVYPFILRYAYTDQCTFGNVAVMRGDLFKKYAAWLFDILFQCEAEIDLSGYDSYQKRVFGFLAERLCGGYIDYLASTEKARVGELGVAFGVFPEPVTDGAAVIANIEAQSAQARSFLVEERVHVTFAIDDNYAPHCGAAIASLLGNINERQQITIHILHDASLSAKNGDLLASLCRREGQETDFIKVDGSDFDYLPNNRAHISRATYYRLVLHKVLPETVRKTIYIDADVILADNICRLWVDLGDNFGAACADEGGVMQLRRLRLPVNHIYFNAGVCVFNLEKLRGCDADMLYLKSFLFNRKLITLQDQDILNIAFCNSMLTLPLRWNANARLYRYNDLEYKYSEAEAREAALHPGLIHYTDSSKPWHPQCRHPLTPLYWQWRARTPWAHRGVQEFLFEIKSQYVKFCGLGRTLEQRLRPYLKRAKKNILAHRG